MEAVRTTYGRKDKRVFAGELEDHGFTYGEVMGWIRITLQDIFREYPGFQLVGLNLRHGLADDEGRLRAYWFWEVRIG